MTRLDPIVAMTFAVALVASVAPARVSGNEHPKGAAPTSHSPRVQTTKDADIVLTPEPSKGLKIGKVAGVQGKAPPDGQRISVQSIDLMQPIAVGLFAVEPTHALKLEIIKGKWTDVIKTCVTDATGSCEVRFRTEDHFGMRVSSVDSHPAGYNAVVWVGDEIQEVPQNVVMPWPVAR